MGYRGFLLFILPQICVALEITSPSSHVTKAGTNTSVPCTFTVGDSPVDLSSLLILWRFQGKLILSYAGTASPLYPGVSLNISRIKDGDASLSIANTTIYDAGIYRCSITYNKENKEKTVRLDVLAPPQITITGRIIIMNKESILSSSITGFYPVDIEVKWFRDGESLHNVKVSSPQRNPDGTYSVTSTVTIIPTEENRDQTFSCRVQHETLSEPLQEDFKLIYGAVPSINIISSTFYLNKEQDLICQAWGFYPESIAVNWFLSGTLVEAAKTRRLNDLAVESIYRFLPTEQTQGMELSCQVGHGTLSSPLVKKLLVQLSGGSPNSCSQWQTLHSAQTPPLPVRSTGDHVTRLSDRQTLHAAQTPPLPVRSTGDHVTQLSDIQTLHAAQTPPLPVRSTDDHVTRLSDRQTLHAAQTPPLPVRSTDDHVTRLSDRQTLHAAQTPPLPVRSTDDHVTRLSDRQTLHAAQTPPLPVRSTDDHVTRLSDRQTLHAAQTPPLPVRSTDDHVTRLSDRQTLYAAQTPPLPAHCACQKLRRSFPPVDKKPVTFTLCDSGEVMCSINLVGFPSDIIITTWSSGKHPIDEIFHSTLQIIPSENGNTYEAISKCRVHWESFNRPLRVTWKHESMKMPDYRNLWLTDLPWHPAIEEIEVSALLVGSESKLQCQISNYFPDSVTVTWFKKEKGKFNHVPVPSSDFYKIPDLLSQEQPDHTYSCTACLVFTPSLSTDQGAEFVCRVEHPSLKQPIKKRTGPLHIVAKPEIVEPVHLTLCDSGEVMCSLSLMRFSPKNISISWTSGEAGSLENIESSKKISENEDETIDAISECRVPWEYFKKPLRVTWKHKSMEERQYKDLGITDFPWRPAVEEIEVPSLLVRSESKLQCKISHYFPDPVTVTWFKKEKGSDDFQIISSPSYKIQDPNSQGQPDHAYSCTACLVFTPSLSSDQGAEFICRVEHPSLKQPIEKRTEPLQVMYSPKVRNINLAGEDSISVMVDSFYPDKIAISWKNFATSKDLPSSLSHVQNPDGSYKAESRCQIREKTDVNNLRTLQVMVEHDTLENPICKHIIQDYPWTPIVEEIGIPVLLALQEATLQCKISNYFPDSLTVTWFKKEKDSDELANVTSFYRYNTPDLLSQQQPDHTYSCTACLVFTPSLIADQGAEFACRVEHPSLEQPIERRTKPLQVMGESIPASHYLDCNPSFVL
ncbi:uncharacterized protein RCH25_038045 [Pelodytes ibericus]